MYLTMNWMDIVVKFLIGMGFIAGIFDAVQNNRFGLAEKFRQGFYMIGSMMLSMTGIMSIAPVIALILKPVAVPVFRILHMDPSILGVLLSCDMGGYPLAMSLAEDRRIGLMMGITTAGMLGGTLTFSIPVGAALLKEEKSEDYFQGLLIGVSCIPVGSIINGILLKIPFSQVIWNNILIILLTVLILAGMKYRPVQMSRIMRSLARTMEILGLFGIGLGGIQYLIGKELIPSFTPLMDSMETVCRMGITLIGMLPAIEILLRLLKKSLEALGRRIGIDGVSTSGLLISMVTTVPVYPLMEQMPRRGLIINSVWTVFCSSILGSQMGLIMGIDSNLLLPFYISRLAAAFTAVLAASVILNREQSG